MIKILYIFGNFILKRLEKLVAFILYIGIEGILLGTIIFFSLFFVWDGFLTNPIVSFPEFRDMLNSDWGLLSALRKRWDGRPQGLNFLVASEISNLTALELLAIICTFVSFFLKKDVKSIIYRTVVTFFLTVRNVWLLSILLQTIVLIRRNPGDFDIMFLAFKIGSESGAVWGLIWGFILGSIACFKGRVTTQKSGSTFGGDTP